MIAGDIVSIRLLEKEDLSQRVRWLNDPAIYMTLLSDYPVSKARTLSWFDKNATDHTKKHFSIVDNSSGDLIGMTGFLQISQKNHHAQMYVTIGEKEYRGKGLARQVIQLLLRHGFSEMGLAKIFLWTLPNNQHARNIYEKIGFRKEGEFSEHVFCRGAQQNLIQHGITRSEFVSLYSLNQKS